MLLDEFLPEFQFSAKHRILIRSTPAKVYAQLENFDFTESWVIRTLTWLRGFRSKAPLKRGLAQDGFIELATRPGEEILTGLVGQFWKPDGNLQRISSDEFRAFDRPGFVKAAFNFLVLPERTDRTVVETETRVLCLGDQARRKFSMYWLLIKPFSGLIRTEMLRILKKQAERA